MNTAARYLIWGLLLSNCDYDYNYDYDYDYSDWTGLEVVSKYLTDIASNKTFYTDSNGRRWMKRIRDYRKYWNLSTSTETVSRNYYPLTSAICLRDSSRQATLLIDRPEGGTSMRDGEIEIMVAFNA